MDHPEQRLREDELNQLRARLATLESQLHKTPPHWEAQGFYGLYHATAGLMLGIIGAAASLLFNVIGSLMVNQDPMQLIKVYLTFPLGEKALSPDFNNNIALALGCCLYLGTGMLFGVPFQLILARFLPRAGIAGRLVAATVLGLVLWLVNFYGILSWLQPAVTGGKWIIDPKVLPPLVGAATHLVFAWTMAIVFPWGNYQPYFRQTETVSQG
jgi:hypothetical protein